MPEGVKKDSGWRPRHQWRPDRRILLCGVHSNYIKVSKSFNIKSNLGITVWSSYDNFETKCLAKLDRGINSISPRICSLFISHIVYDTKFWHESKPTRPDKTADMLYRYKYMLWRLLAYARKLSVPQLIDPPPLQRVSGKSLACRMSGWLWISVVV